MKERFLSLAEDLKSERTKVATNALCHTCTWLSELDEKDRKAIEEWMSDSSLPKSNLRRVCRQHGLTVSETAFKRHIERHVEKS